MTPAEQLAKRFHETYEALAPQMGYETRKASAVPWESVPEKNRALMIATCNAILEDGIEADTIAALRAELQVVQEFVPCNLCKGTGMVEVYPPYPDGRDEASCPMCLGDGVKPHKAFAATQARVAALRDVVEEVEWIDYDGDLYCPVCLGQFGGAGHTRACKLKAALALPAAAVPGAE